MTDSIHPPSLLRELAVEFDVACPPLPVDACTVYPRACGECEFIPNGVVCINESRMKERSDSWHRWLAGRRE